MLKVKDEPIVLSKNDFSEIFHLADMLGWEIDRMSSGGQGVYNNLMDKLEAALKKAGQQSNASDKIVIE